MAFTPTSSRYPRTFSPPLSSGTGSTIGPHVSRLNIVTRLAIEGNAKEGDGVPIRMYLRLTIPADSVTPGSTIPLFKEENVKIVASDVHPLDHASTPYNFSSAQSPLLHNAARALGLPARLSQSYMTLFSPQSTNSSRYMSASGNVDALDERYTGYVTISGWQVSFVLPKELPPRSRLSNSLDDDRGEYTPVASKLRSRRSSIGEKNMMQFMVGIRMAIPYTSRPPRAPWLLSIPTPRCLSNSLRLRIFPIQSSTSTSSSYQSLSSEGESEQPPWDVTADPHVTRLPTSRRSAYQHQNFADDEGSDSASPGFSEDVGVQGTFPSTERIRIRWAQPQRTVDDGPTDGRRRVGVETVQGEMLCEVLGRATERTGDREGVVMRLEYKGSCKGVWFPGVATLLGLDVGLEAKGCDVGWARHHEARWTVIGDVGYTGHEIGTSNDLPGRDRQMVFDMPQITSPDLPSTSLSNGHPTISRHSSSSSTASLLRIPLPASQNSFEYSFEGSPAASGSEAGLSSVLSTTDGGSKGRSRASSVNEPEPPSTSITLHLNINDILPPNPEPFTFTISGTVLVMPRSRRLEPSGTDRNRPSDELAVSLPRFRAFAADTEMIRTTVRNAVDATVGGMSVSASSDIKAKQTELKPGGRMKLGSDGGRVTLHSDSATRGLSPFPRAGLEFDALDSASASRGVSPTPLSRRQRANSNASVRDTYFSPTRPSRTGELMIPYANATITPFLGSGEGYAVRLALPAPVDHNRDWLDIYLAHPSLGRASSADSSRIKLISATLEDVPVQCQSEIISRESKEASSIASLQNTDDTSWLSLLRVYTGTYTGGIIELVYSVDGEKARKKKTKSNSARVDVMLPIFEIPVGRLQVDVMSGQNAVKIETNFEHQHIYPTSTRLCHFHMQGPFAPSVTISPALAPRVITPLSILKRTLGLVTRIATILALLSAVFLALTLYGEIARVRQALDRFSQEQYYYTEATAPVVTVTATILSPTLPFGTQAPLPTTDPISAREPDKAQMDVPVTIIEPAFAGPDQPKYHSTSTQGDNALLPLHYVYDWRYFLFSRLPTVDGARRAFFSSLGFVWSYVRWGFHYPLD